MPLYEYFCDHCHVVAELRHSIRETPAPSCTGCGRTMRRLISGGDPPMVRGGTPTTAAMRSAEKKNAEDMAHAHAVADRIKADAQPKTQAALRNAPTLKKDN